MKWLKEAFSISKAARSPEELGRQLIDELKRRSDTRITVVESLLLKGADLSVTDEENNTVLHLWSAKPAFGFDKSTESNASDIQRMIETGIADFIKKGVDPAAKNIHGQTAAERRLGRQLTDELKKTKPDTEKCTALIDAAATLNEKEYRGETPLMLAVLRCDYMIMAKLVRKKVNIDDMDDNGMTALHHAIENLRPVTAKNLILDGANPELMRKNGETSFDMAKRLCLYDSIMDGLRAHEREKMDRIEKIAHQGSSIVRESAPVPQLAKKPFPLHDRGKA